MSKSVNLRFDGGSVGQQQQSATPHTIRNLTVRDMIITESGVAYSKQVLCDLDTPISGEPGFSPVSPEQLAQYVNAGDYIQLDLQAVMDSPESSVYRAFFNTVAFVNTSAGETTSSFNAYVLETDSRKFLNPVEVVFMVASDQLTSIQYLVVYDTRTLENTMVHDLILQDSIIVVDGSPTTKHILCDKQHKIGNSFTPVSPAKLATWISRGDYIALGMEAANDDSTVSPLPMTNAVLSDGKCSQITFGGLSEDDTTKFGTGVIVIDQATGIEYIHIDVIHTAEADVIFLVQSNEISPYESDDEGIVKYLKTATDNEYVTAEMVKAWIDSGKLLVIKESLYVYYLTAYEDQGETESGRQYRLAFICNAFMYLTRRRLVRTYLSENAGGYSTSRMRMWSRSSSPSWYNVSEEIQDLVIENYIDIESIENPPSDIYRIINNAIPNGSIPVIRYKDAFYYFDKDYIDGDRYHTYSFVGKLDSDEWETVIRVSSEGVTIGNVLGVNGTVANGVHNSFPLGGGKCGAESGDPDLPYMTFDSNVYASYATFNGNGGHGYVSNGITDPVSVTLNNVTTVISPTRKAFIMAVQRPVVNPSSICKGYILIEKNGLTVAAGSANFFYDYNVHEIVEADGYYVLVLELTMNRTEELTGLLDTQYTVHGGFWVKTDHTDAVNGLANGPRSLATGQGTSAALNNGTAAGALSLANGNGAFAAAPYSVALHEESIAAHAALACGNHALALHSESKVLAAEGVSGRPFQTVLGRKNKLDPESAVVVGWIDKNITKIDTDGYIFTGKRLDLANNIMPLYLMSDSDPDSPGTVPGAGYWICDSQKQLVTAAEIFELYSKGMNFVLYNNLPGNNSRTFWLNKSSISALGVDMEFVSTQDNEIQIYVVNDTVTPEVTDNSLYVSSSETTYIERQWSREPETVTVGLETYAPVVNGVLALTQTHRIAKVLLKAGNMGGGTTFTVKVQKNTLGEITDNIVYVVNDTSSTVTVSVKYQNDTMSSVGTLTINNGYAGYVKINPMYFEVVNAGFVVIQ